REDEACGLLRDPDPETGAGGAGRLRRDAALPQAESGRAVGDPAIGDAPGVSAVEAPLAEDDRGYDLGRALRDPERPDDRARKRLPRQRRDLDRCADAPPVDRIVARDLSGGPADDGDCVASADFALARDEHRPADG